MQLPARWRQHPALPGAAATLAAACWGISGTLAGHVFEQGVPPLAVVALRTWLAAAGLTVLLRVRGRPLRGPVPRVAVGYGLCTALANGFLFVAISLLPVAVALVLQNLAPVLLIAGGLVVARRWPSPSVVIAQALALVGLALVVGLTGRDTSRVSGLGLLVGVGSAVAVAAFSALGARSTRKLGALRTNFVGFAVASGVWAVGMAVTGELVSTRWTPMVLVEVAGIGLFGTFSAFLLYAWATARSGATVGAVVMCLEPLFGGVIAFVVLGQRLTGWQVAGAMLLIGSVVALTTVLTRPDRNTHASTMP